MMTCTPVSLLIRLSFLSSKDFSILGTCLDKEVILVNEMDELYQKRFFPVGINTHLEQSIGDWWYKDYLWYNNTMGHLGCCSDTFAAMHYVSERQMFELDYFVYHVHPYGLDKNSTETLPKKLSMRQIIAASDTKGFGSSFTDHEPIHNFDDSEYF